MTAAAEAPRRSVLGTISDLRWVHRFVRMRFPRLRPEEREELVAELLAEVVGRIRRQPRLDELEPEAVCTIALREARRTTVEQAFGPEGVRLVEEVEVVAPVVQAVEEPALPITGLRPGTRITATCEHCGLGFRPGHRNRARRFCGRPGCVNERILAANRAADARRRARANSR